METNNNGEYDNESADGVNIRIARHLGLAYF